VIPAEKERPEAGSLLPDLLTEPAVVLNRFAAAEVVQLEELADLDLALLIVGIGTALNPLDRFFLRLALQEPVARDQLLRFGQGTIDYRALVAGEPDA
jgi:hypothetical protein